jgi:cytochrome o ubiquinol oxidase operon protein cyoD
MILLLALVQIMVQLHFFLHLGRSRSQRANMVAFLFTALVAMIVIGGAIWIMNNLNNNMQMTPHDMDSYMRNQ